LRIRPRRRGTCGGTAGSGFGIGGALWDAGAGGVFGAAANALGFAAGRSERDAG